MKCQPSCCPSALSLVQSQLLQFCPSHAYMYLRLHNIVCMHVYHSTGEICVLTSKYLCSALLQSLHTSILLHMQRLLIGTWHCAEAECLSTVSLLVETPSLLQHSRLRHMSWWCMHAAGGRAGLCGQSGGGLAGQPGGRRSADRGETKAPPADPGQASAGASTTARYAKVSMTKLLLLLFHGYCFMSTGSHPPSHILISRDKSMPCTHLVMNLQP